MQAGSAVAPGGETSSGWLAIADPFRHGSQSAGGYCHPGRVRRLDGPAAFVSGGSGTRGAAIDPEPGEPRLRRRQAVGAASPWPLGQGPAALFGKEVLPQA